MKHAHYPTQPNPSLLHQFDYFQFVRAHRVAYNQSQMNSREDFTAPGAWKKGNDVDPNTGDAFPTRGNICEAIKYLDFNPTKIEKWKRLARIEQPVSGSHYLFRWLGFRSGYRADTYSESQLDNTVVAARGLDGARTKPHIPHTPDDGEHYFQRTLALGEPSTAYDANVLEQEGVLQHHPNFNINPVAEGDHPLTLLYPTVREHFAICW